MTLSFEDFDEYETHKKFKQLNIPKFNLDQIDKTLITKYHAEEVDVKLFPELKKDPYFNLSYLTKCYAIQDQSVLQNLFSDEEKVFQSEYIKSNGILNNNNNVDHSILKDRIHAVSQGSLLYIFFQSKDGKYLSPFISTYGPCEKIMNELIVYKGIDHSKCVIGNMDYKLFLFSLIKAGFISL